MKFQRSFVWRYDPLEFITKNRQNFKLGPFIHHPIPKIEAYANQTKWVEGTLVDQDNTRVDKENALIDLERKLDEGSFLQVSNQSDQPKTTMTTPPIMQTPQNEEKNLKRSREDATTFIRETSYAQLETSQVKRQKMNLVFEQEDTEGSAEVTNTEGNIIRPTTPSEGRQDPSTSQT